MKSISIPMPWGGRMHVAFEKDGAMHTGGLKMGTNVTALHVRAEAKDAFERAMRMPFANIALDRLDAKGRSLLRDLERLHLVERRNLGSGLVTNVGVMAMAHEAVTLAAPSGARINVLFLANQHFSGKGVTGAAATDIKIETISTNGGQTAVAGTQSSAYAANTQTYRTIATISYSGAEAVTEWGLHTSATRTATTGSPFTAVTATTWQDTGSLQTASSATVQGLQQFIVEAGTTTVWGMTDTNTTHIATLVNNGATGWWKTADGTAGSTPGNTEAYTIRPVLWDHKVFSAINVAGGDSIQFTYTLTINSGG